MTSETVGQKLNKLIVGIFGSRNERLIKEMLPTIEQVNSFEPKMQRLSDADLRKKTEELRDRLTHGERLDDILPEAFAVAREGSRRVIWTPDAENPVPMRHFDVQILGGMMLHQGKIAEMATGEGKTLVATLAAYLNALEGKGVHVVTVNDYLARRDKEWMGPLYEFLGLTAGVIQHGQDYPSKAAAYQCDITFGRDQEFGFDYLRDNMAVAVEHQVQRRGLNFAIVDEVDSVLIDEARVPLILSGGSEETTEKYYQADRVAGRLKKGEHFEVKEKDQTVYLTENGVVTAEKLLGIDNLYAGWDNDWPHLLHQSLVAHALYKRDVRYVVKGGEVIIVDEFTGRLQPGRRWSDGLHQAVEAKEHLRIKEENQTWATVTYQNFYRMYKKLAGMTGTAMTEAAEFDNIYKLDVVNLPTNRPLIRTEFPDVVFGTEAEKFDAIEEEIVRQHATGRPLLVGTISIEKSELLSERLTRRGIKHEVLNAKHHEREAHIIANAGQLATVTIATNMAGRGTDIMLGAFSRQELIEHWQKTGLASKHLNTSLPEEELRKKLIEQWAEVYLDEKTRESAAPAEWESELQRHCRREGLPMPLLTDRVADLGGLHVVGTERHEARRIDNQLRGRSGRQGDPGSSRFFLSLEDDLMRIFASERVAAILRRIGMSKGMALEHGMVTGSIQRAQKKVEEHNFEIRKHLLEYDEVMDEQRKAIYGQRQALLETNDVSATIQKMIEECLYDEIDLAIPSEDAPEARNFSPLAEWAKGFGVELQYEEWNESDYGKLRDLFAQRAAAAMIADPANGRDAEKKGDAPSMPAQLFADRATGIFCRREEMFKEWDVAGLEAWARNADVIGRHGAAVPADAVTARIIDAIVARGMKGARESYQGIDSDSTIETLAEDAMSRFLPTSQPPGEWDLDGLAAWANAIGISLPVNQWREDEPSEEEAVDFEQTRRAEIRKRTLERLQTHFKNAPPVDVVAKLVETEARKLLGPQAEDEAPSTKPLSNWLSRNLSIPLSEGDIRETVEAEMERIQLDVARHAEKARGSSTLTQFAERCNRDLFDAFMNKDLSQPERDMTRLAFYCLRKYGVQASPYDLSKLTIEEMSRNLLERIRAAYKAREEQISSEKMRMIEKFVLLQKTDMKWKDHLLGMDHLKTGIGLRGYAQVDPKVEYTREARRMFDELQASLREEVTDLLLKVELRTEDRGPSSVFSGAREATPSTTETARFQRQQEAAAAGGSTEKPRPIVTGDRVGRNSPCPCGSGKKYKNCCGRMR